MGTKKILNVKAGMLLLLLVLVPVVAADFMVTQTHFTISSNTLNVTLPYPQIRMPVGGSFTFDVTLSHNSSYGIVALVNKSGSGSGDITFVNGGPNNDNVSLGLVDSSNSTVRIDASGVGSFNPTIHTFSLNDTKFDSESFNIEINNTNPIDPAFIETLTSPVNIGDSITAGLRIRNPNADIVNVTVFYCLEPEDSTYLCDSSTANDTDFRIMSLWDNYSKVLSTSGLDAGSYFLNVSVEYRDGEAIPSTAQDSSSFVISTPVTTTTLGSGGGGGGGGGVTGGATSDTSPKLTILSPSEEKICGGLTETKIVRVEAGTDHTNLELGLSGIPGEWLTITPSKISEIDSGSQATFILTYQTSEDLDNYQVTYTATTDQTSVQSKGVVSVVRCEIPIEKSDRLQLEIQSLRATIQEVLRATITSTTATRETIDMIEGSLEKLLDAEAAIDEGDLETAQLLITESRKGLEDAILDSPIRRGFELPERLDDNLLYAFVIAIVIVAASLITYFKRRSKTIFKTGGFKSTYSSGRFEVVNKKFKRKPAFSTSDQMYNHKKKLLKRLVKKLEKD